jgi:hypothetical protein
LQTASLLAAFADSQLPCASFPYSVRTMIITASP